MSNINGLPINLYPNLEVPEIFLPDLNFTLKSSIKMSIPINGKLNKEQEKNQCLP